MENRRKKSRRGKALFYLSVSVFALLTLFPFCWILLTSFKSPEELYSLSPVLRRPTIKPYIAVFTLRPFARYLLNSLVVSGLTTLIAVLVAEVTAYAVARLRFPGKTLILGTVLAVSMFPAIATITPIYIFIRDVGLRNSYPGLVIPYISFALPMAIWYLTSFFKEIPFEMEEAARIDGASPLTTFVRIVAPLAAPGVFTTAILVFISAWNEYLFAFTINTEDLMRTVPVGITMYPGQYTVPWAEISAAIIVVTVPLVVMVLVFQRRIVGGLAAGAVKG